MFILFAVDGVGVAIDLGMAAASVLSLPRLWRISLFNLSLSTAIFHPTHTYTWPK